MVLFEFSGTVRDAFTARGHHAESCDLLPSEAPGIHYQGDFRDTLHMLNTFDLCIAHPPCTHLAVSGARWWKGKDPRDIADALHVVYTLMHANCERIAIENPVSSISTVFRPPDQIVQPWWFGHGEVKATCLWLKNLPLLESTNVVSGRVPRVHYASPGPDRWKERSRTLQGLADAMAEQWGCLP